MQVDKPWAFVDWAPSEFVKLIFASSPPLQVQPYLASTS
jgi:hypothetical protein